MIKRLQVLTSILGMIWMGCAGQGSPAGNEVLAATPTPNLIGYVMVRARCESLPYRACHQCDFQECHIECNVDTQCASFTFKFRPGYEECRMSRRLCNESADIVVDPFNVGLWNTYNKILQRDDSGGAMGDVPTHANVLGYVRIYGKCLLPQTSFCSNCTLMQCKNFCDIVTPAECSNFLYNPVTGQCLAVPRDKCRRALFMNQWATYVRL